MFASDPSAAQVAQATQHPQVRYAVEPAERCSLADASADLVAVAQALHWFDFARFFAEVRRVLRPGGVFAAWSYGLMRIDPAVDAVVHAFEHGTVGPYWPPERRHVDAGYATIDFPFEAIALPSSPPPPLMFDELGDEIPAVGNSLTKVPLYHPLCML